MYYILQLNFQNVFTNIDFREQFRTFQKKYFEMKIWICQFTLGCKLTNRQGKLTNRQGKLTNPYFHFKILFLKSPELFTKINIREHTLKDEIKYRIHCYDFVSPTSAS